jgi:hypothetical protein
MLVEAHRLRRRGIDVVIEFFNPHAYESYSVQRIAASAPPIRYVNTDKAPGTEGVRP